MSAESVLLAADTVRMQGGGKSIYEKAADALTAGTAGATISGLASIYNTAVEVANVFGADADKLNVSRILSDLNVNWGKYYNENKDVLDTVGFIGGSLIPGGLAVKGLNLFRAGEAVGTFRTVLGYTARKQKHYLEEGLQQIAAEGGTIFNKINTNKLISIAYGGADQAIQVAAYEVATALTMKQSPLLENEQWGDLMWDITKSTLAGGVLGGAIEGIFTNRIFKQAGKAVDLRQRDYDTLIALDKMGLKIGDESFSIIDSILNLPKEVLEADKTLNFSYKLQGKTTPVKLDVGGLYNKALNNTIEKGLLEFRGKLTNIVGTDPSVGAPVAEAFINIVQQGKKDGVTDTQIRDRLGSYLWNLAKIEGVGASPTDLTREVLYFQKGVKMEKDGAFVNPFLSARQTSDDIAYRLAVPFSELQTGVLGKDVVTLTDAWRHEFDYVLDPKKREYIVNPHSKNLLKVDESTYLTTGFNTRLLRTSDVIIPTVADVATADKALKVSINGVEAGKRSFQFSQDILVDPVDAVEATARHLWATEIKKFTGTVSADDISVMDALLQATATGSQSFIDPKLKIKTLDGGSVFFKDITNFEQFAYQNKVELAAALTKKLEGTDIRELALRLNVEYPWMQTAIEREFNPAFLQEGWRRPLAEYSKRENVIFRYEATAAETAADFPDGMLAYEYRKKLAADKRESAAAYTLGQEYDKFPMVSSAELTKLADATGTGAGTFSFANANYGDKLRVWAQEVGKNVNLVTARMRDTFLNKIQPAAAELTADPKAGAELAAVLTKFRFTQEPLALYARDGQYALVDLASFEAWNKTPGAVASFKYSLPLNAKVGRFLEAHHEVHREQLDKSKVLAASQGMPQHWNPNQLYLPPIDTRRVPFFAFVRPIEGKVFGNSDVAMITARSDEELQRLIQNLPDDFKVYTKKDTEAYFKAKGDYEYRRALNQPTIDPFLRKQGRLGDYMPSLDVEATLEDFVNYHSRQATKLVRDSVSVKYAQTFAELDHLSNEYTKIATSSYKVLGKEFEKTVKDPFGDYTKLALDISKRSEFTLWHQANEFVDALGTKAYRIAESSFMQAKEGKLDWQEANALLERMGLGTPFKNEHAFAIAQTANDRNILKLAISKANVALSNIVLRFDAANAVINTISTLILLPAELSSIRNSIKNNPELVGKLAELTHVKVPGMDVSMPTTLKLLHQATKNFWGADKAQLLARYKDIGAIKDLNSLFHKMIEDLALTPKLVPSEYSKKVDAVIEGISKWTGNNFAEEFTRFVSADVMRQLTDPLVKAGKMAIQEQNSYISIFVNRAQGNYIAAQRPIAFQGTLGAAIGLFQTYQFNLYQQLFRHIGDKNFKTIAVMGGMQTTIFGLNGLPLFEAVNTHIIGNANINEGHRDAYSFAATVDKEWGDWLMYGSASAFPLFSEKMPSLFTRGDLNPRHVTIIPVTPRQVPAVEASVRLVGNLVDMGNKLANGGKFTDVLLQGLEHNGISRPLAGLAAVMQGFSSTSRGSLIAAHDDLFSIATASRLIGAKPMDEAIALNAKYRLEAYKAADTARMERLGEPIKDALRRRGTLTEDEFFDFMDRYAAVGGRIENFSRALQRWNKNANESVLNEVARHMNTARGKRMAEIMGADPVDDFTNTPQK